MINENDPVMGGGHYECSKCGETVFGSALHHCSDKEIKFETIELSKKQEESNETWDSIFGKYFGMMMKEPLISNFLTHCKKNYSPPQKR